MAVPLRQFLPSPGTWRSIISPCHCKALLAQLCVDASCFSTLLCQASPITPCSAAPKSLVYSYVKFNLTEPMKNFKSGKDPGLITPGFTSHARHRLNTRTALSSRLSGRATFSSYEEEI